MKNKLLLIVFTGLFLNLNAQNYYYVKKNGSSSDYLLGNGTATPNNILGTGNDILSTAQTIPFTWNYYGSPVTSFKASDNGYITFDGTATTTTGVNTTLPDVAGPNNAIYAFWDDLELKTYQSYAVGVRTWTTGTTPNRNYYIQWMLNTKNGIPVSTAHALYYAIKIKEAGGFEVIHNYGFGQTFSGTVGCENSDGSLGVQVLGSPNITNAVGGWSNATDIVYDFTYGTQPALEPALINNTIAKFYKVGTGVTLSGTVSNYGSTPITSLTVNYAIGSGATQSNTLTGLNILPSGENTVSVSSNIPWTSGAAGSLSDVKFWISDPNSGVDENLTNNEITKTNILRNNGTSNISRNVLFEEATGAWCGYCPDGHLRMKDVEEQHGSRVIPVMHHNADGMATTNGDIINSTYAGGFPDGFIDRAIFPPDRGTWASEINNRLAIDAPVAVTITAKNFNSTTRVITYKVNARFSDYWAGDLRIGAIVSEDNVRGTNNNQWSQVTYFTSATGHRLAGFASPMVGYLHQHVTRSMPGGAWGVAEVIPDVAMPNTDYSYDFTYTLPAANTVSYTVSNNTDYCSTNPGNGWNLPSNINLIGYVAEYDNDASKRPVLNAGSAPLWNFANDIKQAQNNISINKVYPNPANNSANVSINLAKNSNVKVIITNQLGQVVSTEQNGEMEAGINVLFINTSALANGIYTVTVNTENSSTSSLLNIVR